MSSLPSHIYDFVSTREDTGSCANCRYVLPNLVGCAPEYFKTGFVSCGHCGTKVDVWKTASERAVSRFPTSWLLHSLGAAQTSIVMRMETGKYYEIDLQEHHVPMGAKIVSVRCHPQGGEHGFVMPLEWHPNPDLGRFEGTLLRLVAVPFGDGPIPRSGQALININWIRPEDSDAWPYLITAFETAASHEYAPSMVFAQSAVEISMMPVIESKLLVHASADRVERFFTESLTYSHALNVMLPCFCGEAGVPPMPDAIRGALNKLRKTRNAIIHKGQKAAAISPEAAMEGTLCGSIRV